VGLAAINEAAGKGGRDAGSPQGIRSETPEKHMRYDTLLSRAVREFIAETATFHDPGMAAEDWAAQRQAYDRMAAHFHQGRPEGLVVTENRRAEVPLRRYGAPSPVTILFVHGGGFVLGGLESHDDLCAELAQRSGCQLVAVHWG